MVTLFEENPTLRTNTIERFTGSTSILKHLNNAKDIVFVSTRDIELIDLLKDQQFAISHFNETIENNNLTFDYNKAWLTQHNQCYKNTRTL